MKRYLGVISAIIISLLLSACNSSIQDATTKSPVEESQEVDIDVEKKIREIKENLQEGFEVTVVDKFFLTGNTTPEIVEITAEMVPDFESGKVVVTVYQYSLKTKEWEVALKREEEDVYEIPTLISDEGQVAKDGREQVVVSKWEGSGGFLSFFILGSVDKKTVSILLDKWSGAYSDGQVHFEKGKIGISENGTISNTFKWDGKSLLALDDYNDASYQDNLEEENSSQPNESAILPITYDELPIIGGSMADYLSKFGHKMQKLNYFHYGFEFWFGKEDDDGFVVVSPPYPENDEDPMYRILGRENPMHEIISSEDEIYIYILWLEHDLEPEELRQIALKTLPSDAEFVREGPDAYTKNSHLYFYKSDSIKARTGFGYIEIRLFRGYDARILLFGESDEGAKNYMNSNLGEEED
ncbi:hypothetical protein [Sporosarcina sp. Marseille-Q4943]|uniref:hypothetical protein n=1 Tax=Sporosarcina sp. Marseille-Q4943 TaxID=2942204 RepID=UPI00208DBEA0|nr:hypothetical protein [Sporosarcina sp. Marseille-Q4943]